ncbi:DsrE family protein [Haloprofundus salilacus]|uniref:DsrE family protein n=1 Tax=Haloprofundus salilacus TaxID=2876190 RepID=UPI001CCEA4BC|nr:DsrE family protein [Haloprofundus salilacus]
MKIGGTLSVRETHPFADRPLSTSVIKASPQVRSTEMDSEHTRRRVLELAGVGTGLALAGCVGGASDTPASNGDAASPTPDPTESPDKPETETETPDPTMSTVFHFTADESHQEHALGNVRNLLADDTVDLDDVVLLVNGSGFKLVLEEQTEHAEKLRELLDQGVSICACENSMERFSATEDDLVDGVETVPSGVGELTKLQAGEGYAYIKTP